MTKWKKAEEIPAEWMPGDVILDEYRIEEELGRGGMGRVWLVKSTATGRSYAVKQALIRDAELRRVFLEELQTWIDLPEHPNIVPCRFFRTVNEEIVIFADYVEGGSLADWIATGRLTTLQQILNVAIQSAQGLHAIHEQGLVHQDMKPANVLMAVDGRPMITDFGLARVRVHAKRGAPAGDADSSGQPNAFISPGGMTPAYASPEQRAGAPISRGTDIWSWGVSVLDMFVGDVSCPYGGHIAAEVLQVWNQEAELGDNECRMPPFMLRVLQKCFAHNLRSRWTSMSEVLSDIANQCDFTSTGADALPRCHLSEQSSGSRRGHASASRVTLSGIKELYRYTGIRPPMLPGRSRENLTVNDFVELCNLEALVDVRRESLSPKEQMHYARLLLEKALLQAEHGDVEGGMATCNKGEDICKKILERHAHPDLADDTRILHLAILNNHAMLCLVSKRQECALDCLRQAAYAGKEHLRKTRQQVHQQKIAHSTGISLINLMSYMVSHRLHEEAWGIAELAIDVALRHRLSEILAMAYGNQSLILRSARRPREALGRIDDAIEMWDSVLREHEVVTVEHVTHCAMDMMTKAGLLRQLKQDEEALQILDRARIVLQSYHDASYSAHQDTLASVLGNMASLLLDRHEPDSAMALIEEAIGIRERLVEKEGKTEYLPDLGIDYVTRSRIRDIERGG